ncbi:MAG: hypothetical protein JW704_04105 [Anaerolineaceae bacterium]|nr:hypothetical protein [Anaerolineaceae bacterium]
MNQHRIIPVSSIFRVMVACLLVFVFSSPFIQPVSSAAGVMLTLNVDTTSDLGSSSACVDGTPNDCSLRGAVNHANGDIANDYVINIPDGTYLLNYTAGVPNEDLNANGDLDITHPNVTLQGASPTGTIIDGFSNERVIEQFGDALTINALTIRNGLQDSGQGGGGGILVHNDASLSMDSVHVLDNEVTCLLEGSDNGGGIHGMNYASLTITNSLIQGNKACNGGGIRAVAPTLIIQNSSIEDNIADIPVTTTTGSMGGGGRHWIWWNDLARPGNLRWQQCRPRGRSL